MNSQKISSQVSTFANEPWRENLLGIDIHQIDQKSRNSGKLIPQSLFFTKREYLKKNIQSTSERQMVSNKEMNDRKVLKKILKSSEVVVFSCSTDYLFRKFLKILGKTSQPLRHTA